MPSERVTVSIVVTILVRKGLVERTPDAGDQRQKELRLTAAGVTLWGKLPKLTFVRDICFRRFLRCRHRNDGASAENGD